MRGNIVPDILDISQNIVYSQNKVRGHVFKWLGTWQPVTPSFNVMF